jgi:TolA-binding protein
LEYLLDSLSAKLELLDTPESRDAQAWLGEYLFAMSDARRAAELRKIPNLLDLNAAQLWQEIRRIDRLRATLGQRQENVVARQEVLAERAAAKRQATAAASQAAAARARSAPAHSPYRQGGGSAPFSDVQRRPPMFIGLFGGLMGF